MVNYLPPDSASHPPRPLDILIPLSQTTPARTLSIFVLEPNQKVLNYLERALGPVYDLHLFTDAAIFCEALRSTSSSSPDLVLFAWEDPERSLPVLHTLRAGKPTVPIVFLSCSSELSDHEIFAGMGGTAVVLKPFLPAQVQAAIGKFLHNPIPHAAVPAHEIELDEGHSFVRSNPRMCEIEKQATLVARSGIPVLILGESGTGKEILALFTHKMSQRSHRMFLKVNCAAMPAELLESELFGYEQGAFTGALKTKPGKFEVCDGGTIFLDEIGEMPAILQAKLLQVLQDGTFSRLGSRSPMRTDVRVIAATNINMKQSIAGKTFREDLYYRLNGLSLVLPPLRQRLDEIPALSAYFLRKGAKKYGLKELTISPFLLAAFSRYHWPGNLRELENCINRLLILRDERAIFTELNAEPATPPAPDAEPRVSAGSSGLKRLVQGVKGEAEIAAIASALEETGWNRKAAAANLQISYKALLYKIKQYELAPAQSA